MNKSALRSILWAFACHFLAAQLAFGADYSSKNCADLLFEINAQLKTKGEASNFDDLERVKEATVEQTVKMPGQHGGARVGVRRIGSQWGSEATTLGYDAQGDPRWFIELLGVEGAKYFGYEVIDQALMTIPDQKEFSAALEKVNAELVRWNAEPVAITYYQTATESNTKVREYNQKFIDGFSIPISPGGHHMIHDMSYHTGAIFLPRSLLEYKAGMVAFYRDFGRHLVAKYSSTTNEAHAAAKFYAYAFELMSTIDVDRGTALVGPALMSFIRREESPELKNVPLVGFMAESVREFVPGAKTAAQELASAIKSLHENSHLKPESLQRHLIQLTQDKIAQDLFAFAATYRSKEFPSFKATEVFVVKDEEVCEEIQNRRKQIADAVARILTKK